MLSRQNHVLEKSVVAFLERKNYSHLEPLGKGGFGDIMAAQSPKNQRVAVKIIKKEKSWRVEEQIWPLLQHVNILPVSDTFEMPELGLDIYVSPRHPAALDQMIQGVQFRADPRGLDKIRKWFREILCGLDYLHSTGFAHMDLKTDNILISSSDSAVICDFSGLSITAMKITRFCSPIPFRAPECWQPVAAQGVEGEPFDVWTFGLVALNALTGHWPQLHMHVGQNWSWDRDTKPILIKAMEESIFSTLMKHSFPCVPISLKELQDARHFVLSLMRLLPFERPTVKQILSHHFLRYAGLTTCHLHMKGSDADILVSKEKESSVQPPKKSVCRSQDACRDTSATFNSASEITATTVSTESHPSADTCYVEAHMCSIENDSLTRHKRALEKEKISMKKKIKGWFHKKWRRAFHNKNYVLLSQDDSN